MLMASASEIRMVSNTGEIARHANFALCIGTEPFVIRPSFRPDARRDESVWTASEKSRQALGNPAR